ncbi:glycosyltransferase family 2 protein [Selenihalanaerobacter shriftii]|uniref:Glucosyl-3-phosphoglycerate synthase n=1 Tax=Selenihalanaerobacter shriftii TaxID=142842 RepID=A0A1T4P0T7_9FIRM|nr:glycosyltransferase family 2 protein [Selenihalanaerobacter shriftii]SJZ85230.1 Glycosyl transferase family 2 [Selenihalanaerobacter shriftii]
MLNKEVTVLVPAYNEEDKIGDTISSLQQLEDVNEIIVINDGSTDKTVNIVKEFKDIKLIDLKINQGKGEALNQGLSEIKGQIISLIDADLGKTALELRKLLKPVLQQEVDMTIAKFPAPKKKGGFGLVTTLARVGLKIFTGLQFDSPLSGQRVLTKNLISYLNGFESGFGVEVGMTIKTIKGGFKVKEVPVNMSHQETGRDWMGFKHRGRQFKDVLTVFLSQIQGGK